jgi:hypothetical protein
MTVSGWFDSETRRLDIRDSLRPAEEALASYAVGDVVLAQVREVYDDRAVLLLHPDAPVTVTRDDVTANDLDDLRSLMTAGEVLSARVTSPGPDWRLTLLDVDDDEVPVQAASLLAGGPPWLETPPLEQPATDWLEEPTGPALPVTDHVAFDMATSDAAAPPAPAPVREVPPASPLPLPTPLLFDRHRRAGGTPAPTSPSPAPSPTMASMSLTIDALRAEVNAAKERLHAVESELQASQAERATLVLHRQEQERFVSRLEHELKSQRSKLRKAKQPSRASEQTPEFADREAGFRHAVVTAWAVRTPLGEQKDRPLVDYSIGPDFLDSLEKTPGINVAKVADVVFEIVTGRVHEITGRDLHQVRSSSGPTSDYLRREDDGATLWRAALQRNTPQARRIHYWALTNGSVELSHVALHDDI